MKSFLTTIFCVAIVVVEEGLFHSLITFGSSDLAYLGTYEKARKVYAKCNINPAFLLLIIDAN